MRLALQIRHDEPLAWINFRFVRDHRYQYEQPIQLFGELLRSNPDDPSLI
ncbi:MAG: hypothetical protein J7J76_03390 [Candidatus Latescibacteria bacterium]|nr:hypothetical protein [Candidatus Latescibacterota bacterium]